MGVQLFSASGELRDQMREIGHKFSLREDGVGSTQKQYWMLAGENMFREGERYVFGKQGGAVYDLEKSDDPTRHQLEHIASHIATAAGYPPRADLEPYTVICKYTSGMGVGAHKDNDFDTTYDTIVSMTLIGKAVFSVLVQNKWHDIPLGEGDTVIFDRHILHKRSTGRES